MLKINGLTKKFPREEAVKKISFEIKEGEIFSLIGPNGSGKTTIIKIIAGLLHPTSGSVSVNGKDIQKDPVAAKAQIGYIPDEPSVWPQVTGEEFLHITGALYGIDEKTRHKRMSELLNHFSLKGIEKRYFEDYSRGNKQKFTILAALLHRPKLLLIDEPIVGLDPVSAKKAGKIFQQFAKEGGSIFLVTHTLNVAELIANRIGILKMGKIEAVGTMSELRAKAGLESDTSLNDVYLALT